MPRARASRSPLRGRPRRALLPALLGLGLVLTAVSADDVSREGRTASKGQAVADSALPAGTALPETGALERPGDQVTVGGLRFSRDECRLAAGPRRGRHRDEVVRRLRELRPHETAKLTDIDLLRLVPAVVRASEGMTPARSQLTGQQHGLVSETPQ